MKTKILGLLAVGLLAGPITVSASVIYEYTGSSNNQSFTFVYEAPDFISSRTVLEAPYSLDPLACAPIACFRVVFDPSGASPDLLEFSAARQGDFTRTFQDGALGAFGTYSTLSGYPVGQLVVRSGHAVPEPGTLALLGLGLAGLGLSRRRKAN